MSRLLKAAGGALSVLPRLLPLRGPGAAAADSSRRIHFVDLLRIVASVQMVQGHTLDALMGPELRSGAAFDTWSWVRGLSSVAFMVAAGFSFHLSTLARFDRHKGDPAAVRRRLRRGAWLVVLGYLLHFPAGLFGGDAAAAAEALRQLQIADVLQCIGLTILLLEGLVLLARRPTQVVWASAALAVACFSLAPLTESVDPAGPWRFVLNYATHRGGSLFPLLPWAGYILASVVAAQLVLPRGVRTRSEVAVSRAFALGALALGAALVLRHVPWSLAPEGITTNALPSFGLLKLGVVWLFIGGLAAASSRIVHLPRPVCILAGETLMLYVFHLLALYGAGVGLFHLVGPTLSLPAAIVTAASMIALTAAVGLGWHVLKRRARDGGWLRRWLGRAPRPLARPAPAASVDGRR